MKMNREELENRISQLMEDLDATIQKRKEAAYDNNTDAYISLFQACQILDKELEKAESELIKLDSEKWNCEGMTRKLDNLLLHCSGDVYYVSSSGIAKLWCSKDRLSYHIHKLNQSAARR